LAAVPAFLEVSEFFFLSKDYLAVKARQQLDKKKPFYTYLYQDFRDLHGALKDYTKLQEQTAANTEPVTKLLKQFERVSSRSLLHGSTVSSPISIHSLSKFVPLLV
jgi:hypothetical protein